MKESIVGGGERHGSYGILLDRVTIVETIADLDRSIVTKLIGTHDLDIVQHDRSRERRHIAIGIEKCLTTGLDNVVDSPRAREIAQAVVDGEISYKCILVESHSA